jgi:pimeloyl-ACP methyl ester carboxylesterase
MATVGSAAAVPNEKVNPIHEGTTGWIQRALERRPARNSVIVEGTRIAYRTWGEASGRDVILVHGGGAHSGWWDHIAPLLAEQGRIVALDLSGHGNSDHRKHYSMSLWGEEVLAVRQAAGLDSESTMIGHSLGGLITLHLRERVEAVLDQAIVVDSPIGGPDAQDLPEAEGFVSQHRVYASCDLAAERFRPVPVQTTLPELRDHLAQDSVRPVEGGWTWKFDAQIFNGTARLLTTLPTPGGRLAYLRGERGMVAPAVRGVIEGAGGIFLDLPDAGHAPMLDQPAALVTAFRALIAGWDTRGAARPAV